MKTKSWVIVTGAGGGIGEIVVKKLLSNNYKVICLDKKIPIINLKNKFNKIDYADSLEFLEINLEFIVKDNKNKYFNEKKIFESIKGKKLCAVIHLAAIQKLGHFSELSLEDWRTSFEINLFKVELF